MADKGVILEYDFAAMDGATILFETMKRFLEELDGIAFDETIEARHFAGGNYQGCFAEYFPVVKTKKTAVKAGKDFDTAFRAALAAAIPTSITTPVRDFIRTLAEKNVKVVISTRADLELVRPAFEALLGPSVELYHEESTTYGSLKWDAWRRACVSAGLKSYNAIAVTASGLGVRAALRASIGSVAVMNHRTAYQDFTGCDEFFKKLDVAAARKILELLRV